MSIQGEALLNERIKKASSALDSVMTQLGAIQDKIHSQIDEVEEKFEEKLNKLFVGLDHRVEVLEDKKPEIRGDVDQIKIQIEDLSKKLIDPQSI